MISIAMATYNGSKYIREQLNSILTQSFQDFELVICDDCSTDTTWDILEEYAKSDNRIRLHRNEKNIGYRKNFEGLVKLCQGEFIAFCDQDDIWETNHLEVLYKNIGNKAVCTANADIIDGEGKPMGFKLSEYTGLKHFPENDLDKAYVYFYYLNPFPGCNTMFRKSFLEFAYPINDERIKLHDIYADALACICGAGINYVDEVTMRYRFHKDSVTSGSKKRFMSAFRCCLRKLATDPRRTHNYVTDRDAYCTEMVAKNMDLKPNQARFLKQAHRYHARRNTLRGRFLNFIFDLAHFRLIYMK